MSRDKRNDLDLTGYYDLFRTDEERMEAAKPKVEDIPLNELVPFRDHPFQVKEDEELERLKESIRESGVLVPGLARPKEDGGYELISGHRRMAACRALGLSTMPIIVRKLSDEEAVITMVDANLQREHLLPSEKAFAYKMKYEAMKHQGTSSQVGTKLRTDEMLAHNSGDSRNQIQRYIRLTRLIPEILRMVDSGRIALTPAVELSYLNGIEQQVLYRVMESDEVTPSLSQAQRLHRLSQEKGLTDDEIMDVMREEKGNQREYVKIPVEELRCFFQPGTSYRQMTETLVKAMDYYQKQQTRIKERDAR